MKACIFQRPRALQGSTMTMVDDSGHLRPEFQRSKSAGRAWGTFVGTWDLPSKLPGKFHTSIA